MKRFLSAFIVMVMMLGSMSTVALAQRAATPEPVGETEVTEGELAYARGLNAEAILFSERGDTIATLVVTDVERDWQDYGSFYEPAAGKEYVAVTFEVTMESRGSIAVSSYSFQLLDGWGFMNSSAWVEADELSDVEVLTQDLNVASGETVESVIVFEVYEGAPFGYLVWQAEYGFFVMVDLTDEGF
jgi:hypothetical protein